MNRRCPECDLRFDREPGYFIGAMYISYAISLPVGGATLFLIWYFTRWEIWKALLLMILVYLPNVPFLVRYSRVLWLHWDRMIDPDD